MQGLTDQIIADEFRDVAIKIAEEMIAKMANLQSQKELRNYLNQTIVNWLSQPELAERLNGTSRRRLASTLGLVDLLTSSQSWPEGIIAKRPYQYPGQPGGDETYLSLIAGYLIGGMVGIGPKMIGIYARQIESRRIRLKDRLKILKESGLKTIFLALLAATYKHRLSSFNQRFTPLGCLDRKDNQFWPEILLEKIFGESLLNGLSRCHQDTAIDLLRAFARQVGQANKMFMSSQPDQLRSVLPELSKEIEALFTMESRHRLWYNAMLAAFLLGLITHWTFISSLIFLACGIVAMAYRRFERGEWSIIAQRYKHYISDTYFIFGELVPREMVLQPLAIKISDLGRAKLTNNFGDVIQEDWLKPILLLDISSSRLYARAYWLGIEEGFFGLNIEKEITALKSTNSFCLPGWRWIIRKTIQRLRRTKTEGNRYESNKVNP